jgi:hypothetical protein
MSILQPHYKRLILPLTSLFQYLLYKLHIFPIQIVSTGIFFKDRYNKGPELVRKNNDLQYKLADNRPI